MKEGMDEIHLVRTENWYRRLIPEHLGTILHDKKLWAEFDTSDCLPPFTNHLHTWNWLLPSFMKNIDDHFFHAFFLLEPFQNHGSVPRYSSKRFVKETEELLDLLDLEGQRTPRLEDLQGFALNSKGRELKKAIERVGRGDVGDLRSGLQKLLGRRVRRINKAILGGKKHVNLEHRLF